MNPKQKKTREENAVESHFIVNKEDVKHATEKSVKEQIVDKKYILKNVTEKLRKISRMLFLLKKNIQLRQKKGLKKLNLK